MLDDELRNLLEGGCALIVGSVDAAGSPHAARGWGLDVVSLDPCVARLLVDAHDTRALADLVAGRPVAITGADVPTLRSVQLKGTSRGVADPAEGDEARTARYVQGFYDDIERTDGTPRPVLRRMTPAAVVPVLVEVEEVFDQTPGPAAGRPVVGGR